ncbi:hypothetical protein CBER1_11891 [Cercospora berteroae]|uniref:Uncharacterized protein n=1 Tax=Cercospora berteroae TaxID=357750 RepID=A0A2S6C0P1_9PEZI|nr:hypothetical protein CBER1_11891 [Cercospora berteroae]
MCGARQNLAQEFKLSTTKEDKPIMRLAGITGNRPSALRRLQYKELKIALLPNYNGGNRLRLVIDFTFEYTKRYLSGKDANTFPIPDIPSKSYLLLYP